METPSSSESEEDAQPRRVPCESLRITYEDPLTRICRAEEVFLDPRDLWSRGKSLLLVNSAALVALQAKSDKEQSYAVSSQGATKKCRRDYLRERRLLLDELQRLLELDSNVPKAMLAEAQEVLDQADVEYGPEVSQMVFSESDQRLAVEFYVPRNDDDDEILNHLTKAKVELGDEVCTRLLVQKVRSMHSDNLKKRESMRQLLEELAGSDLASDKGPSDIEGKVKLIHGMIIQAQNQAASWTEIGMTVMDAAAKKWAQLKDEEEVPGTCKNVLQETEDVMTDNLRAQYQSMVHKQKDYSVKLKQFYGLLAQEEEQAAMLMDLKAKAEASEGQAEIKEAEHRRLMSGYQQRHAAREAKRERVKAERTEKAKAEREEARRKYVALKRELQQAAEAAEQQQEETVAPEGADEHVMKQMSQEEKARLQKLEQAVSAFTDKQTTMQARIETLNTQAAEAKEFKEKTMERVAQAKSMLERKKKEAEAAQKQVAQAEEQKKFVVSQVQEISKKKIKFKNQAVERKAAVPPDVDGMIAKLEQDLERVKRPYEELCLEEQQLLAKEKKFQKRIAQRSAELKALKAKEAPKEEVQKKKTSVAEVHERSSERKPQGYRARLRDADPLVPRYQQLYEDQKQRREELQRIQQEKSQAQAEQILSRLPHLTEEEKEELSKKAGPHAQAPVWFMRDEDLRVKAALAAHAAADLDRVLQESRQRSQDIKKDLAGCASALAENFSEAAEVLVEAPKALADEALRADLQKALEAHEACSARAEDAWRLAEAGCAQGRGQALDLEEAACNAREEDLAASCRVLYGLAQAAEGPRARSFEQQWLRAEKKLKNSIWRRSRAPTWRLAHSYAERLETERRTQEELSNHLDVEVKRKVLLEAELLAPAEAKRALASLRHLTRQESPQRLLT